MGLQHQKETDAQAVIGERPVCNSSEPSGDVEVLFSMLAGLNWMTIISGSHGDCLLFLI